MALRMIDESADVLAAYQTYWQSYLQGDMKALASCMDESFQVIGSTEGEIFFSKKEAMTFYQSTADQIAGNAEMRNRRIEQTNVDGLVLITETCDFYILIEGDWVFYSKARLSSLLAKKGDSWKFIQQHGSIPDARTEEGEQVAFNKIKKENIELREAVKRRTIELEQKNRELEIEAALERVRTVAMSMSTSDDLLSICQVTFKELQLLGFDDIRNAVIHIPNDEQKYFMDYDFSSFTGGQIGKVDYGLHPIVDEYLAKIRSAEDAFFEVVIEEEMLDGWNAFRRKSGQMNDQRLDDANALYYDLFSIGIGDIGISTFEPINKTQIEILKRFRNVFGLAYKRYTDIKLAEVQAREAQIEAALERVRAKAMGMHQSEEVGAVSDILFAELNNLDLDIRGCSIVVIDEPEDKMELWRARSNVAVKPFESTSLAKVMYILKKYTPDFFQNSLMLWAREKVN